MSFKICFIDLQMIFSAEYMTALCIINLLKNDARAPKVITNLVIIIGLVSYFHNIIIHNYAL